MIKTLAIVYLLLYMYLVILKCSCSSEMLL